MSNVLERAPRRTARRHLASRCRESADTASLLFSGQEITDIDASLTKHRTEGSFRHVSGMARYGDLPAGSRMTPDFVASWSGPIEQKPEASEAACNLAVPKPGKTFHYGTLTGTSRSMPVLGSTRSFSAGGSGSPCAMHDSAIFRARP